MRLGTLPREAWAMTWAAKVSSMLLIVVTAAMCVAAIVTVGRSASAAAQVAERMEQAGARRLSIIDAMEGGFVNTSTLGLVSGLGTVEKANALGAAFDAANGIVGSGGNRVPTWPVLGDITQVGSLVRGRLPVAGEAIVSVSQLGTLGLEEPVGYLLSADGAHQYPIVGSFTAVAPFEDVAAGALVAMPATAQGRELRVVITDVSAAGPTVSAVIGILAPPDPQGVLIDSPSAIAQTARDLNAQMAGYGRTLLALILAVGGFFVAAVVLADVLIRRRDLGRRRTLGITRTDLVALVTTRTAMTGAIGAAAGCTAAWAVNQSTGFTTPLDFTVAVGVLAAMVALIAALPPAVYASRLDPVAVMRTP